MSKLSLSALALVLATLVSAFAAPASFAAATALSAQETRIVAAAAAENARAIGLLEKLVNINSGTMNLEGVTRIAEIMRAELEPMGFSVRWVPKTELGRAGTLVAEHKGAGRGKRMLLIGHLDTVFEKDSPFQKFVRRGDIAEGPGANDMKDGLSIMVSSLRAMQKAGTLKDADITIVLSGDEERAGKPLEVARAEMLDAAKRSDVALEFESLAQDGGRDMGSVSRRSSLTWTVRTKAKSGHSSGIFSADAGYGAGYELARILDTFRRGLREPNATFSVGLMFGGAATELNAAETGGSATGKSNVIAADGFARGDLRTLSNEQTERLTAKMRDIAAQHLPGTQADISFEEGYPAMAPTEGNRALLRVLNDINRDLHLEPMPELDPLKRGAGDIAFVADKVDGLVGFGAAGQGSHAPGETVDLSSFDRQIKRTALLMTRLSRIKR
ncbi:MAG: M20/M25/M40 family metallo-hydrolase [Gammaproteobacteria bacterium]